MRVALAGVAGLALIAAVTGASQALTAMPRPCIAAVGVAGALLALRAPHASPSALAFACGIAIGALLPRTTPPPFGAVIARPVGAPRNGDIFLLLDRVDANPDSVLGSLVSVSGEWSPSEGERPAAVSRLVMTCCAADAVRVGFDVAPAQPAVCRSGAFAAVSGTLVAGMRDAELRYTITRARVRCAP